MPSTPKSAAYKMGAAVGDIVFAPDYYEGKWFVRLQVERKHRLCANHTTATAWANYLRRQGYRFITLQKHRESA